MAKDNVKLLKKITIRDVLGFSGTSDQIKAQMKELAETDDGEDIISVAGDIRGYGSTSTQLGQAIFFVGTFVARNEATGAVFKAGKIYLPKDLSENLSAEFDKRKNEGALTFASSISVMPHKSSGHTFISQDMKSAEVINREQELLSEFPDQKRLNAPKKK